MMRGARGTWRGFFALSNLPLKPLNCLNPGSLLCEAARLARSKQQLYVCKVEKDDEARSAALTLLARGMITPSQAAELAGVSRQLVRYWLETAGIDWRRAFDRRQATMWRKEIAALNGKVLRAPSKKELRKRGRSAQAKWNANQAK